MEERDLRHTLDDDVEEMYPDARDADYSKTHHVCEEHRDAYGLCQICGRAIPGTTAAFDLFGDIAVEDE